MTFAEAMERVAQAFEVAGVAVLVLGGIVSAVRAARADAPGGFYREMRVQFGHTLLLGLEILVAADIVKTVAVESTFESVAVLGVLVLVRTLLSISLDAEIDGVMPWRRRGQELAEAGVDLDAAKGSGA